MISLDDLFQGSFIMVNKTMIKVLGLEASVMLGELYSEYNYWKENNGLTENGYFYSTRENVENNTGLSRAKQDRAINVLESVGVIKKYIYGMPAKRYFKFVQEGIEDLRMFMDSEEKKSGKVPEESANKVVNNFQAYW